MFSFLGLEDNDTDHILIHKERLYTFPMGIMCGAMVGAANYMSAIQAATYDRKFRFLFFSYTVFYSSKKKAFVYYVLTYH